VGKINNTFSNSLPAASSVNQSGGKGENIKLEFDPKTLGATRQKDGRYPPTKAVTENTVETALLKHFGFDINNSTDAARVRQLLRIDGSPFAALETKGDLVAVYNNRAGKYEIVDNVEKNLYKQLQGKAAEVKTRIEREKQNTPSNPANPNDVIAGKNGITNNKRAELENKLNNQPSISAPNGNESEKTVKSITGAIESVTGTSDPFAASEIGKQLNRLGVSSVRLAGKAMELSNYLGEKLNDAVRSVAPDSVDELLNQADKANRENAQALQNASSAVTNEDTFIDAKAKQSGWEIPVAEDLANKAMYFPEAIPNAIDSAIKGDFKDDDGSYSDRVGKIIGGLNPAGDARDIVADGKRVADGEKGGWIKLGATVIGAVPIVGDAGKALIKTEEKAIIKGLEKTAEKEIVEETVEKVVKEEVEQTVKQTGKLIIEDGRTLSKSEQEFADKMVAEGKTVKARAESTVSGVKNPDFEIDNEITEFKYISDLKGTDIDTLSGGLSRRILDGGSQASKVTLNVSNQTGMDKEAAERAIKRAFGSLRKRNSEAIKEVRIYGKDFDMTVLYEK